MSRTVYLVVGCSGDVLPMRDDDGAPCARAAVCSNDGESLLNLRPEA